ncbi:MAG: hypothetical protein HON90_04555 [Halobacteriovoraceae bacterium]|jgi:hypothetical protein|nr:hypothetical protein [Halobacteriovoraceae bacterium]
MKIALIILFLSQLGYADDFMNSDNLDDRPVATKEETKAPARSVVIENETIVVQTTVKSPTLKACERKDQTTIPLRAFRMLLWKSGKLKPNYNASNERLSLAIQDDGQMISNCNNMFKIAVSDVSGKHPYLYEANIIKPDTCEMRDVEDEEGETVSREFCQYEVRKKVKNSSGGKGFKFWAEPNYYGFKECLKKTGVLVAGKKLSENVDSFVLDRFTAPTLEHASKSGRVLYHCKGPLCDDPGIRFSNKSKLKGGDNCQWFEDIVPGGFTAYSRAAQHRTAMENKFHNICNSSYGVIAKNLISFRPFDDLYSQLKQIMDQNILAEVKNLHIELAETEDYSTLDIGKYKRVIKDFYANIVKPLTEKIKRQVKQVSSLKGASKKSAQARLNNLIAKLIDLNDDGMLGADDYKNMISFLKKAPLRKESWRSAAETLYDVQASVFHYSRYATDASNVFKLPRISLKQAKLEFKEDHDEQAAVLNKLVILDKKRDFSYSNELEKEIDTSEKRRDQYKRNMIANLQEDGRKTDNIIKQACSQNGGNIYTCKDKLEYRQALQNDIANFRQPESEQARTLRMQKDYASKNSQISYWQEIEKQRNAVYNLKPQPSRYGNRGPAQIQDGHYWQSLAMNDQYPNGNWPNNNGPQSNQGWNRTSPYGQQPNQGSNWGNQGSNWGNQGSNWGNQGSNWGNPSSSWSFQFGSQPNNMGNSNQYGPFNNWSRYPQNNNYNRPW